MSIAFNLFYDSYSFFLCRWRCCCCCSPLSFYRNSSRTFTLNSHFSFLFSFQPQCLMSILWIVNTHKIQAPNVRWIVYTFWTNDRRIQQFNLSTHTHRETHRTSLGLSFSFVLSIKDKWFFCKFELKRKAHSVVFVFVLFVHIHDRESRLWFQFHIRNANTHSRTCIVYVQLICVRSKKWYTRSHTHTW